MLVVANSRIRATIHTNKCDAEVVENRSFFSLIGKAAGKHFLQNFYCFFSHFSKISKKKIKYLSNWHLVYKNMVSTVIFFFYALLN